jgi:Fuc2NAc and GlcNAc transferase
VGWLDDRKGLSSGLRLLFYGLASAWAVAWLGGLPELSLGFVSARLGGLGYTLAWVGVFTFTNIYNFMDGIDGLAAAEGTFVTAAAGALLLLSGAGGVALFCWVLGAALCGFIPWNWALAKGLMGDVGSNFLGFTIAVLAIASEGRHSLPALIWVLLLGVFVVDGVATFVRRLLRRKPPHEAHKTHAYQGAVQRGHSHSRVTLAVLLIDAGLAALAWAAWRYPVLLLPSIGGAFTLLLALHWYYSPLRRPENG